MNGAEVRDLEKARSSGFVEIAFEADGAREHVDAPAALAAFRAIAGMDAVVAHVDGDMGEREAFAARIHAQRHDGAGAERGGKQSIGRRPQIAAAEPDRLVDEEPEAPVDGDVGEEALRTVCGSAPGGVLSNGSRSS